LSIAALWCADACCGTTAVNPNRLYAPLSARFPAWVRIPANLAGLPQRLAPGCLSLLRHGFGSSRVSLGLPVGICPSYRWVHSAFISLCHRAHPRSKMRFRILSLRLNNWRKRHAAQSVQNSLGERV